MNSIKCTETMGMAGTMKDWVRTLSVQLKRAQDGTVTQWLVDGIIVDPPSTMIHGLPVNGKSLIAMDLALAAAEGRKWLGAYEIAPQPVLYVDEDGRPRAQRPPPDLRREGGEHVPVLPAPQGFQDHLRSKAPRHDRLVSGTRKGRATR